MDSLALRLGLHENRASESPRELIRKTTETHDLAFILLDLVAESGELVVVDLRFD
jgi:hypothetical protein